MKRSNATALAAAVAGLLAIPVLCLGSASSAGAASVSTWDKVAQCESGGDWSINTGNGYYGGLQFSSSTWAAYGGTAYAARADLATKDQQILIGEKVLAAQGESAWPTCGPAAGLAADTASPFPSSTSTASVTMARTAAGDFNGDGKQDIAAIDANNNLKLYTGDGAGHLTDSGTYMLGNTGLWKGFKEITAGDFTGNGKTDIAGIDANNNLKLYLNDGTGHLTDSGTYMLGNTGLWNGFKAITAGDFTGNGKTDIAGIDANNNLKLYLNDGTGHLSGGSDMLGSTGLWAGFRSLTAGDFNRDGKQDIAGIDANNNMKLYTGNGAGAVSGGSDMLGSTGLWSGF